MEYKTFTFITVAVTSLVSFAAFSNNRLAEALLFSTHGVVKKHEYHRLITSILVHANLGHLFFNMFSLYSFAMYVEASYGYKITAYIYFYSAIGGSLLALLMNRKNSSYRAVGASGGVCGIIFASIFLVPGGSVYLFFVPIPIPAWLFGIIFIVVSIYGVSRNSGNIGHDAHLGGALTGIVMAGTVRPEALMASPLLVTAIVVPSVLLIIFHDRIPGRTRSE